MLHTAAAVAAAVAAAGITQASLHLGSKRPQQPLQGWALQLQVQAIHCFYDCRCLLRVLPLTAAAAAAAAAVGCVRGSSDATAVQPEADECVELCAGHQVLLLALLQD
jgi:hypothetical protein